MNVRPPTTGPEPLAYRLKDAARAVGVTPRFLHDYTKSGELPVCRVGGAVVILKDDLLAFLKARRTSTPGASPP